MTVSAAPARVTERWADVVRTIVCLGCAMFVATFALGGSACSWIPAPVDPELAALERSLTLQIASANRLHRSGAAEFTFKLSNHGTNVAKACLGPSRSVSYRSSGSSGTSGTFVDHPGCTKESSHSSRIVK